MKLVHIVEICDTNGITVTTFTQDDGERAKELFVEIAKENLPNKDDEWFNIALEDGYIECGNWCLYLIYGKLQ